MRCITGDITLHSRGTDDIGDHFSDGRRLGTHRVDKDVFSVCPLDLPLPHHFPKRMNYSWIVLAFAFVVGNTD